MTETTYLKDKTAKKRFFQKGMLVLAAMAVIFTVFIIRFALSGSREDLLNGAPGSDDAYQMAKLFVKPTIKSDNIIFPETGYQCAKKPDSVFIIKSYAEAKDQPKPKNITTFEITLKFIGGAVADKNNWKLINIIEE
jgi:hypothetical protein